MGERLLEAAHELAPDLIVISGDLTQRAKPAEFASAVEFLNRMPEAPQIVVPGNHDVPLYRFWERLSAPRRLFRRYVNEETNPVLNLPEACIVGLDSTDPYRALKNGRISRRQIARLQAQYAAAENQRWRLLVLHHHLIPAPSFSSPPPMPRARRLLNALTNAGVELVLAGHLHRAYVGNSLDVFAGSARDAGIVVVHCGTSTSRRGRGFEREKNSFNWIELRPQELRVDHFIYFSDGKRFEPTSRHTFARPAARRLADD